MGCLMWCFGASKKRNKHAHITNSPHPNTNLRNQYNAVPQNVVVNQEILQKPVKVLESRDVLEQPLSLDKFHEESSLGKPEEQLSLGKPEEKLSPITQRKVTFDSNVKEYEHVSFDEAPDSIQEYGKGSHNVIDAKCKEPGKSSSVSASSSSLSSSGSFPPNHRYQNCRESDDEDEELDCAISDLDEVEDGFDEGDEDYDAEYSDDEYHPLELQEFSPSSCPSMESGTGSALSHLANDRHLIDPKRIGGSPDKEENTPPGFYCGARDRAGYVHSVLNPVENTAHWKAVKAKGTPLLKQQKENFQMDVGFEQSSSKSKLKFAEPQNSHEVAVDASLSTWLVASQKTPQSKVAPFGSEPLASGASLSSYGSNSVRSHEERPIMGALTMEDLKHFSASNSPGRFTSRSPNEKPIVGIVGVHWNSGSSRTPVEESGSASSFKGIPNTSSKYREDKRVNWHSTPFETRLERALNRGAADSRT